MATDGLPHQMPAGLPAPALPTPAMVMVHEPESWVVESPAQLKPRKLKARKAPLIPQEAPMTALTAPLVPHEVPMTARWSDEVPGTAPLVLAACALGSALGSALSVADVAAAEQAAEEAAQAKEATARAAAEAAQVTARLAAAACEAKEAEAAAHGTFGRTLRTVEEVTAADGNPRADIAHAQLLYHDGACHRIANIIIMVHDLPQDHVAAPD